MPIRRLCTLVIAAGLILALAACGSSGGKSTATKTPRKTATVSRSVTPPATGANATAEATVSSSGGGTGADSTPQAPSGPTQAPRLIGNSSTYRVTFSVASDPSNLQPLVERGQNGRLPTRLTVTVGNGQIQFSSQDRSFFRLTGTVDASGNFTATGSGRIDPYNNVEATFTGTLSGGQLTGSYALGTNGGLPGHQPITYSVTGSTQDRTTPGQ